MTRILDSFPTPGPLESHSPSPAILLTPQAPDHKWPWSMSTFVYRSESWKCEKFHIHAYVYIYLYGNPDAYVYRYIYICRCMSMYIYIYLILCISPLSGLEVKLQELQLTPSRPSKWDTCSKAWQSACHHLCVVTIKSVWADYGISNHTFGPWAMNPFAQIHLSSKNANWIASLHLMFTEQFICDILLNFSSENAWRFIITH